MGKSGIEMEDSVDHTRKKSENELFDFDVKTEGDKLPPTGAAADDVGESVNGLKDPNKVTNEANGKTTIVKSEIDGKIKSNVEPMKAEGSVGEQRNTESLNEELINSKTKANEQIAATNADEEPKDEVVEQSPTNGGLKEEKSNLNEKTTDNFDAENSPGKNKQLPTELSAADKVSQSQNAALDEDGEINDTDDAKQVETTKHEGKNNASSHINNHQEPATPTSLVTNSPATKAGDRSGETIKNVFTLATLPLMGESDDGTPEDQAAFMKELESFYRERAMDFKPPKFYGQPLNCLKLWRSVIRLGGYDRVTGSKLWRQIGESFHPPKTCTTVSWTFRIFFEKSLLEYEKCKTQIGELQFPTEAAGVETEGNVYQGSASGSGRARRDAASRAMQGWHAQRLFPSGEVGEPVIKDKNLNNTAKHEKNLKSIGSLKQKRPNDVEHSSKAARTETSNQLLTSVIDVGPPADWVKINVLQTKDCFEVYALVPGLLREEVRVQSDPAGRLVITGQPEQVDNPWGITPFKKVVSLPARIDPLQTSAVVSLHGRLFVRVPFEQSNT